MTLADGQTFAYELGDTLGVGASGKVKIGMHRCVSLSLALWLSGCRAV